ncbi:hypothetical protein HNP25_000696 [Arcicella rosea]|uniref:Uncharacterized protein n=1 Tax=Arcicella rosea TaxID=502909 RepID=A0A841ED34_9BACT|nr:hypothetical protein [Arcicella rosea]
MRNIKDYMVASFDTDKQSQFPMIYAQNFQQLKKWKLIWKSDK